MANVWGTQGSQLTPESLPAIKQALTVLALVFPQPDFLLFPFGPGCSSNDGTAPVISLDRHVFSAGSTLP